MKQFCDDPFADQLDKPRLGASEEFDENCFGGIAVPCLKLTQR